MYRYRNKLFLEVSNIVLDKQAFTDLCIKRYMLCE